MGGFKNKGVNTLMAKKIIKDIIVKVLQCSELMVKDCNEKGQKIQNNEEDIRDYLFFNYLNNEEIREELGLDNYRFSSEVPENYINNKPKGRIDLHVYSIDMFKYPKQYFTFECKRIDGSKKLNRFYLEKGVKRFTDINGPLYSSYFQSNCMFGFVVKEIDIVLNTKKINELQNREYPTINVINEINSIEIKQEYINTYISSYSVNESTIELFHLFYDVSTLIV
jgi:hypothetical protein